MAHRWMVCALVFGFGAVLALSAPAPEAKETIIRLSLQPMPLPRPALKYQLLPETFELHSGNAIQGYLKCFMEQNAFFHNKEIVEKREKYLSLPLDELPLKELQGYGRIPLGNADDAARLDTVDWQVLRLMRRDGIQLLLPELQQMRMLANALKLRLRIEVAEKRFDDAVRSIKTLFAMARHCGEHPTLIAHLVGVAIAYSSLSALDELISRPDCPNLYWAFASLPDPLVSVRKGLSWERGWLVGSELPELRTLEPMSAEQLDKLVKKVHAMFKIAGSAPKGGFEAWIDRKLKDEAHLKAARQRLIDSGIDEKMVQRYLPAQVLLLDERRTFEEEQDEIAKWVYLPYEQMELALSARSTGTPREGLFTGIVASIYKVRQHTIRLQQRLALLRILEALRAHAAEKGQFPENLSEVKLPLPADPVTGKPFQYKLEAGKATLKGTSPREQSANPLFNLRYVLSLKK